MASTVVEQTRLLHQDIEVHRENIVTDLLEETKTNKDRILQEHRVQIRLDKIQESATRLLELYDDVDKVRKEELEDMTGENVFSTFYDHLKDIRDYHRKFPDAVESEDMEVKPKVKFQGAEVFGMFVDLHPFFERYVNMTGVYKKTNYRAFLANFDKFSEVHSAKKKHNYKAYKSYITDLQNYLMDFQQRTNALVDVKELLQIVDEEFKKAWDAKTLTGWQTNDKAKGAAKGANGANGANGAGDATVSMEDEVDEESPLYCKVCRKMFKNEKSFTDHLAGRKHKKNVARMGKGGAAQTKEDPRAKELAQIEFRITSFADLLRTVIVATQEHIEKKQTRTYEEIAADLEEQQAEDVLSSSDDDDDEKPVYNPLNLPLGWDGKPIPYWLYKFHGLNIEKKCEICGGYSYWGPRAFERHFSEWRHTYGLRCLGITNSKEFMFITKFEDAIALNEKMTKGAAGSSWEPDEEEEFEDDEGNVFNKKTYEDLKRQGII